MIDGKVTCGRAPFEPGQHGRNGGTHGRGKQRTEGSTHEREGQHLHPRWEVCPHGDSPIQGQGGSTAPGSFSVHSDASSTWGWPVRYSSAPLRHQTIIRHVAPSHLRSLSGGCAQLPTPKGDRRKGLCSSSRATIHPQPRPLVVRLPSGSPICSFDVSQPVPQSPHSCAASPFLLPSDRCSFAPSRRSRSAASLCAVWCSNDNDWCPDAAGCVAWPWRVWQVPGVGRRDGTQSSGSMVAVC